MHPAPHSFIHLHLAHFKLHPALRNTLNVIRTDIAQNWKIGKHGILEVLIPNPDLDFWNSDPKIQFWANFGRKSQSCSFAWKLAHIVSRGCWFLLQHFLNFQSKIHFWANLDQKSQSCPYYLKIDTHDISRMRIFRPTLGFWISKPKSIFEQS